MQGEQSPAMKEAATVILTLIDLEETQRRVEVAWGSNLRQVLLDQDFSPYTRYTARLNCGGRGLCATCGTSRARSTLQSPASGSPPPPSRPASALRGASTPGSGTQMAQAPHRRAYQAGG